MPTVEELTAQLEKDRHPGAELGRFLLSHSNSKEYLQGILKMYLEAATCDVNAEREWHSRMMTYLVNSEKNGPTREPKLLPSHPEG